MKKYTSQLCEWTLNISLEHFKTFSFFFKFFIFLSYLIVPKNTSETHILQFFLRILSKTLPQIFPKIITHSCLKMLKSITDACNKLTGCLQITPHQNQTCCQQPKVHSPLTEACDSPPQHKMLTHKLSIYNKAHALK